MTVVSWFFRRNAAGRAGVEALLLGSSVYTSNKSIRKLNVNKVWIGEVTRPGAVRGCGEAALRHPVSLPVRLAACVAAGLHLRIH